MPTAILLDVSLSMAAPVTVSEGAGAGEELYQKRHLAVHGICHLLDYFAQSARTESTALMVFSSMWQVVTRFSREFSTMKRLLMDVELFDKTCVDVGLVGASHLVTDTWRDNTPYTQVVLVTDGNTGVTAGSLQRCLAEERDRQAAAGVENGSDGKAAAGFPLPFPFPSFLHIVALTDPADPAFLHSRPLYESLIEMNGGCGKLWFPQVTAVATASTHLSLDSTQKLFAALARQFYSPFTCNLHCGSLVSHVQLSPRPEPVKMGSGINDEWRLGNDIKTIGFRQVGDFAIPAVVNRYLVIPITEKMYDESKATNSDDLLSSPTTSSSDNSGKEASALVLLHGALKLSKMIALCLLADNWYGMLFSWAENKKRSSIMLAPFKPGAESCEWLGPLTNLGTMPSMDATLSSELPKLPVLPKPIQKRSYADPDTVLSWIRPNGLQSDIQKILRTAKRLPEKETLFYRELNKLRRNALGVGMLELLGGIAGLLERECAQLALSPDHHPTTTFHLTHAANSLRAAAGKSYTQNIMPYSFDG